MKTKVDGASLLASIEKLFTRFLVVDSGLPLVLALWSLATHIYEGFDCFPYLAVTSPAKRCGKTRVAELLENVCANPLRTVGITSAALFRTIEKRKPVLLIDEAEVLRGRDERATALREILNAGYRKGQKVIRCEGKTYQPREFETFCPKVLVLIGELSDTLADRCIPVRMRRHTSEQLERFRFARVKAEVGPLAATMKRWARANRRAVARWYEKNDAPCLEDREAELWLPLFAVCAVAAPGRMPELEVVALQLSGAKAASEPADLGVKLLTDIQIIFGVPGRDRLATTELLSELNRIPESPWLGWSQGRGLDARSLSNIVRPFAIQPKNIRLNQQVVKGYERNDFEDAWARYLLPASSRYAATSPINTGESGDAASATPSATASATGSPSNGSSATVADSSGSQNDGIGNDGAGCSVIADGRVPSLAEFAEELDGVAIQ